jgi:hypothetical protein
MMGKKKQIRFMWQAIYIACRNLYVFLPYRRQKHSVLHRLCPANFINSSFLTLNAEDDKGNYLMSFPQRAFPFAAW